MIVLMPAFREIFGRINRIAYIPRAVWASLDQAHRCERTVDDLTLEKRRMRPESANNPRQGRVHIQLIVVKMRRQRRDDDRDRGVIDALVMIEVQIPIPLHKLDRTL